MNKKQKHISATVAVIAIAASVLFLTSKPAQTITLPDGTKIQLVAITTEGDHTIRTGPNWDSLFGWLPRVIRKHLPQGTNEHTSDHPSLIGIWVATPNDSLELENRIKYLLSAEDGIELRPDISSIVIHGHKFLGFSSIPKDAKELTVAVLYRQNAVQASPDDGSEFHTRVGEFHFPAPAVDTPPDFQARPLPQTVGDDDLEVTLTSLLVAPIRKASAYENAFRNFQAKADFEIQTKKDAQPEWDLIGITTSSQDGRGVSANAMGGRSSSVSFSDFPSPSRPWKIAASFAKSSGFDPHELVTFDKIALPSTTETVGIGQSKKVNGCEIALTDLKMATEADGMLSASLKVEGDVVPTFNLDPHDTKITLVSCTAFDGTKLTGGCSGKGTKTSFFKIYRIPTGTVSISLTFAIHKSRTLEFVAKPEIVESLNP